METPLLSISESQLHKEKAALGVPGGVGSGLGAGPSPEGAAQGSKPPSLLPPRPREPRCARRAMSVQAAPGTSPLPTQLHSLTARTQVSVRKPVILERLPGFSFRLRRVACAARPPEAPRKASAFFHSGGANP